MPKHIPIKFTDTLEPSLKKWVKQMITKKSKAKSILNATLAIAALGGIITFGAVFAPMLKTFLDFQKGQKRASYEEYRKIWRNFYRLKQRGIFQFVQEKNGCVVYRLSEKGKEKIKKLIFDEFKLKVPDKWDGKWRLVIFDIPEKFKNARGSLREKLKELEFYQCQKRSIQRKKRRFFFFFGS